MGGKLWDMCMLGDVAVNASNINRRSFVRDKRAVIYKEGIGLQEPVNYLQAFIGHNAKLESFSTVVRPAV